MGATKYILLYRYINESTDTPIINNADETYEKTLEFYTDPDHKYFSKDTVVKAQEMDRLQQVITDGNNASNPKASMLFTYTGTRKIKHKKWATTQKGYVIRDWHKLNRNDIGNNGDYTRRYTTIGAMTPENGGTVVAFQNTFRADFPSKRTILDSADKGDRSNQYGKYYSREHLEDIIKESTPYRLSTGNDYTKHVVPANVNTTRSNYHYDNKLGWIYDFFYSTNGPIGVDFGKNIVYTGVWYSGPQIGFSCNNNSASIGNNGYSSVFIDPSQVETTDIEPHYVDSPDYPYLIKDEYSRIQSTPWFVNSVHSSFSSVLEKAKILSKAIGLNNIQIIKYVNKEDFIKVK